MSTRYHCPGCYTTNRMHGEQCEHEQADIHEIEQAWVQIVARLAAWTAPNPDEGTSVERLQADIADWGELHESVLDELEHQSQVVRSDGHIRLLSDAERKEMVHPTGGDLALVMEHGACDGCLDYGVSAVISWHEMEGFDWDETKERTIDWLNRTGTWERGDFEEPSPARLVESKKHIWTEGHGWAKFARNTVQRMKDAGYIED